MTRTILVRFATNRQRTGDDGMFGTDFADPADAGHYVTGSVSVEQASAKPDTGWQPNPRTLHVDADLSPFAMEAAGGIRAFCEAVAAPEIMTEGRAVPFGIVLLHGFAASFIDSMSRAAQICDAYGSKEVFVFSWPTRGKVDLADYRADQDSSERSSAAVADALTRLLEFLHSAPIRARLQLVAHSMGTRALRFALQAVRQRHPELLNTSVFEHAFLMASDEDDDGLADEERLGPLLALSKHVEVYHSGADLAVAVSQIVNLHPRLGLTGPRDMARLPDKVTAVNASAVGQTLDDDGGGSHFGHQYYRLSQRVISDVVHVLANTPPHDIPSRLVDPTETTSGRSFYLPFDENAGRAAVASAEALKQAEMV